MEIPALLLQNMELSLIDVVDIFDELIITCYYSIIKFFCNMLILFYLKKQRFFSVSC
jgi:hypothetical protein